MNNKAIIILIIVVVFAVAVVGLFLRQNSTNEEEGKPDNIKETQEEIEEIFDITGDVSSVIDANNDFAFDSYSQISKSENGNLFYSPYSIFSALAMTYEGAKGETAEEMKSVFHFPEYDILRPSFAAIYDSLNKKSEDYELKTGNALWTQENFPFLRDYMDRIEKYYGGKAVNLDFINEPEKSRQTINAFIEEQTNNKIKDLIPEGFIDDMTRLILTNAVYFKGTWQWEFDKSHTFVQDFKITPDNIVKTEMMNMDPEKATFNYADTDDLQILELPYKGDNISMLILLPKENLKTIESALGAGKLDEYKAEMKETKLDSISLPKFEFDTKYFMKNTLSALGMPIAFSQDADFSGMTGKKDLFINSVVHQAYIKVDEEGTEAAAATAVMMRAKGVFPQNVFKADHPFIFIIQDKDTGNILFLGRVVDPTE